jgi:hypothetical protein
VTTFQIDTTHSSIDFSIRHLVIAKVRGRFTKFTGTIQLDEADITRSTVSVEIDAASIHTNEEKRDAHLRAADFLDVEKFPVMTFTSKQVERAGDDLRVTGALTIREAWLFTWIFYALALVPTWAVVVFPHTTLAAKLGARSAKYRVEVPLPEGDSVAEQIFRLAFESGASGADPESEVRRVARSQAALLREQERARSGRGAAPAGQSTG